MIRLVQLALFLAFIIPFGWGVNWTVKNWLPMPVVYLIASCVLVGAAYYIVHDVREARQRKARERSGD